MFICPFSVSSKLMMSMKFKTLIVRNFVQLPIDRLSLCCYIIMHTGSIWRLLPSLKKSLVTAYGLTTIISLSVVYYAWWYSTDVFGICIGQSPAGLKARSKGVNDLSVRATFKDGQGSTDRPLWSYYHKKDHLFILVICWPTAAIQGNGPLILCYSTPYELIYFFEFVPYDKLFSQPIERHPVKVNKCDLKGYKRTKGFKRTGVNH